MSDTMNDIEEPTENEDSADEDRRPRRRGRPRGRDLAEATVPRRPGDAAGDVESIQELLVKQEARPTRPTPTRRKTCRRRLHQGGAARAVRPSRGSCRSQETEFVCKRCFLVKHRSQLADKKRTLCRDCA